MVESIQIPPLFLSKLNLKMSEKEISDKIKKANDTDEIRRKQSEAKKGKPSPKRKSVVCLNTGDFLNF